MVYYNLESEYQGDVTKHCGLTIGEVDGNFYELETKLNTLIEKVNGIEEKIQKIEEEFSSFSYTTHDSDICPPGTSNEGTYTMLGHYTMKISGKIDYDTEPSREGNRFGVAILPNQTVTRDLYPDAKFYIFDDEAFSVWDEIGGNPQDWPTAIYIYPKVERMPESNNIKVSLGGKSECNNILKLKIVWNENKTEEYQYIVDEDVILK